jgi:hypothetical protein
MVVTGKGGGGGVGAILYDCEKAWSSINHSILSVFNDADNGAGRLTRIIHISLYLNKDNRSTTILFQPGLFIKSLFGT